MADAAQHDFTPDEIPLPDISGIAIEDDAPLDNLYQEKQLRLLTEPLYASWAGLPERRPWLAAANVGVFTVPGQPPLVPDVFVSADTRPGPLTEKKHRTYFVWEHGKPPDVVVEVVCNREGDELSRKLRGYEHMRASHYVVFDPLGLLGDAVLQQFVLQGGIFVEAERPWFPVLGLGLRVWEGEFETLTERWLRWYDGAGKLIPTGKERADTERQRADTERQRADTERQRADNEKQRADDAEQRLATLAAKLRELGVEPD